MNTNNIKSFSNLKKFTIVSVLVSIILLFLPWVGEISPINIVEMKNEFFDIVDFKDVPFILNLLSNLGYITIFFLLFTIFKIYKSSYNFASILQFINIFILVLLVFSNIFYAGEYKDWIEDHREELKEDLNHDEKNEMEEDLEDFLDDYGIDPEKELYKFFKFTPILFLILFITNYFLIGILARRKRLESIK